MGRNKDKNTIFPLSPDPSLRNESVKAYYGFLKGALEAKRIHNIAITGGFGTGKSSLIRSYEKRNHPIKTALLCILSFVLRIPHSILTLIIWRNSISQVETDRKPLNRFLYVSVGEYASDAEAERIQEEETTSIRAIERRLLLQIFARFRRADLPQSSFRLIPEAWTIRLWLIAVLLGCFVFSAFLLCFHEQLGALLVAVDNMEGGGKCGTRILAFLMKYKTLFRLVLSAYCIGFGALATVFLCVRILPRIRFHAFTVKGANTEFSLEREAAESYLDLYSMELVYCLEKLAKKIDHVVVFEDLDRLDPKDCLYIITRLREINNLVNLRLQKNGEPLRFIYAVNDEFLGSVQHEKFFDYILPVISEMNKRSAGVLFSDKINQIDGDYEISKVFPQFETVASCLSDYRLQNTILNEYQVVLKLYTTTKANGPALGDFQKNEILAFAIYKNCWPGDYHALRENKSQIFTTDGVNVPDEIKSGKYGKLLEVLTKNHLLTLHSLYYANFSEETLAEMYSKHWESAISDPQKHKGIISELDAIQESETECLKAVKAFFTGLNHLEVESPYSTELFRAVVRCMVRCNQSDNSWFFGPNSKLLDCLKLLAKLNSNEEKDEELKVSFFTKSFQHKETNNNIYSASPDDLNSLEITELELRELCRGIKELSYTGIQITDSSDELEDLENIIRSEFRNNGTTPYFE